MSLDPEKLTDQLHAWEGMWKGRVERWLAINRQEDPDFAAMLEHVPDLLRLMVNLIKDPHIPDDEKERLAITVAYVFDPGDAVPEGELGVVGLVDDSVHMAVRLEEMLLHYGPAIVNNWAGKGDVMDIINHICNQRSIYLDDDE
jgi:uncharacterized membrane protein YkvA (DUF1232 family)